MKNVFKILLLLLSFGLSAQNQVGIIKIDGNDLPVYVNQSDIDKIVAKLKAQPVIVQPPVVVTPPVIVQPPVNNSGAKIEAYRYDLLRGFVLSIKINGNTPQEISWDGSTYYPYSVLYQNKNGNSTYYFRSGQTVTKIKIITGNEASNPEIEGNIDTGANSSPPIIPSTENAGEYAQIGEIYYAQDKFILHTASYSGGNVGRYYSVKKDGISIFESNTVDSWQPKEVYWGDHPAETWLPISSGNYDFYFKNNTQTNKNIIVGLICCTVGNSYTQYMAGGLSKSLKWQLLKPNEAANFSLYLANEKADAQAYFNFIAPVFENGNLVLDRIVIDEWNNNMGDLKIPLSGSKNIELFKKSDRSKFIKITVNTSGQDMSPSYTVTAKNGLEIKPNFVQISAYNNRYYKIFNNQSIGYEDSPDYKRL